MAASGGGLVPSPPKRPTIIRPSNDAGHPVPTRPAPPVPGPAVPSRPDVTDKVPSRPQPPHPSRPAGSTRPELPPPSRAQPPPPSKSADVTKSLSFSGLLSKTSEKANSTEVKKRPEITIVSARPMSEIGFRDSKASTPANNPVEALSQSSKPSMSTEDGTGTTGHPPAPAPRVAPRVEKQTNLDSTDSRDPARGPPPRVPRHSLILKNNKNEETDEMENEIKVLIPAVINDDNEKAKGLTHRGPPPPVPRPTVIKPDNSPLGGPHRQPPPVPGRPTVSLEDSERKLDFNESNSISPPRPLGAPPPLPRSPSARNKLPSPVPLRSKNISQKDTIEIHQAGDNKNSDSDSNEKPEKVEDVNDLYAVINKPKRPTIIRPGKPTEEKLKTETKTSEEIKPRLSPRKTENNAESYSEVIDENPVPEFLRKKLKQTVDVESKSEANGVTPTAGGGPTSPLKPRPISSRGPPPATKPKPSVLPKPQVAAKPVSAVKTYEDKHGDTEIENERTESDVKVISSQSEKPGGSLSDISEAVKQLKPAAVKRPTIIRPSRSAKYGSVENISHGSATDKTKSDEMLKPFSDDSAIESKPRPLLPLPNRRPVSLINIHKAVEDDDHISETLTTASSKSSENVSETLRPKPSPRPAARSRPVTMIVSPVSRPPLPSTGPRLAKSSGPSRPQGGPPIQTLTNDIEQDDMKHGSEKEMDHNKANKHVPLGVPVFPKVETEHSSPPKPVRRPPPPKSSPHKTSESSDDEEFVTAKDKPDRPPAGPARKASGSVLRDSSCEDHLKPPRPGGPPPPRKGSVTGSPDKDDGDDELVKKRPSKPEGRPQRPMSVPVKQILPSKPQPPKPHAVKAGKKGHPPLPSRPKPGHPLYFHMMQVPHGIALHDYMAQHDDELSFKTGDLIILERRVDAEWIMGKVNEQEGMFPKDFVKVKMPLPGEKLDDDDSSNDSAEIYYDASAEKPDNIGHGPRCRARFDFDGEGPDDLTFEEGDVIRLVERVGLEWRKGEINGRIGLFPLNFVEIIEDLPEEESDTGNVVKAIFDFEGEEGDLNFQAGESIKVTHVVNEEWLFGEIGNKKGQFPVQFVDHVPHGLPFLSGSTAKGDHSESEAVDKLTASLGMWDSHDDHVQKMNSSAVPSGESHYSEDHVSMATSQGVTPYCIAAYDYPPQTEEDLGFSAGDHIELVERISADWLKGKLGEKIGMFPASFVDVKVDIDTSADHISEPSNSKMGEKFGVALYEFNGEAENELTFKAGDRFEVQDLVEGAEDWRWGIIDGHRGMFPAAFVEVES